MAAATKRGLQEEPGSVWQGKLTCINRARVERSRDQVRAVSDRPIEHRRWHMHKLGLIGPNRKLMSLFGTTFKVLAGSIDSSPLTPKSLRQKIGETNKALPVRGGAG